MPNFIKRIEKFSENKLQPGEQILSTAFLQQKGAFGRASSKAALGLIGILISHFLDKKSQHTKNSTATALVKKFPEGTVLIAITSKKRFLVYKHKEFGTSVESLAAEYHHGDIVKVDLKSRLLMTLVTIHFKDGGSLTLEAVLGQKLNDFARLAI